MKKSFSFFSFLLFVLLLSNNVAFSQPYFQYTDAVNVKINSSIVKYPWAGGLNFVQVSHIDLNQDGVKDLFIFDRTGNKIRTFINDGITGSPSYTYAPEYEALFPKLHDWALLVDYNCDDKEDIFSYSFGGFWVFRNISTPATGLKFQLETSDSTQHSVYNPDVTPFTNTLRDSSNLYVSPVDIPAIVDIDNDGDLDVVTQAITGTFFEFHENQSEEMGFGCDSLIFHMRNRCWGGAAESYLNTDFSFNQPCPGNVIDPELPSNNNTTHNRSADRHSGSCELCLDLNGDGAKEMVVGGILFNNMTSVNNAGTPTFANFVSSDTTFPSNNLNTNAVALTLFPCAYYLDVDNDSVKDLIVSPNSPNLSENFNSIWYYKNVSTTNVPNFQFQKGNFLQDNMIDVGQGAYPVFFDYDNDGLQDLFIGNDGYYDVTGFKYTITLFKNIGTPNLPAFQLVTRDYDSLSLLHLQNIVPTFADLDGDGDKDMIVGAYDGHLHYFENNAPVGGTANFVLSQPFLKNSHGFRIDVGDNASPQLVDVDNDGKSDLVIGGQNGKLAYLHNITTSSSPYPQFDSITYHFGYVNTKTQYQFYGYSYPCMFKQGTTTKMLVGDVDGYLRLYDNIDGNLNGHFTLVDSLYENIWQGTRTAPTLADLDNDGYKELVLGNYQGGVTYYKGVATLTSINEIENKQQWHVDVFPNPAKDNITLRINGDNTGAFYVDIYNLVGQLMLSERLTNTSTIINTQTLSSGMYICKVSEKNADGSIKATAPAKRIVVQH